MLLAWSAAVAIVSSILLMIAASAVRNSWERPVIGMPAAGPPWQLSLRVPLALVDAGMWTAAILGGGGVIAGLAAVSRGVRVPARPLLALAFAAVAAFTVLPPAGSTDTLDYAAYGRMVVLGHSPYSMTPDELRRTGDPVGRAAPDTWGTFVTIDGPLATAEQWAAAELGGTSAARIAFWLKLWNVIGFGAVALALDRMARGHPARRARAHLLWSVNPLLLWVLMASGHVDVLAAALGFLGLLALRKKTPSAEPGALRGLTAGLLVGAAADLKATYVLFGLGLAWAARRSAAAWFGAAAGAALVLVPSYVGFGPGAAKALLSRDSQTSIGNYYQTVIGSHVYAVPHTALVGVLAFAAVAALMLWRLPDGVPLLPAVRPVLAITLAWLFVWPYQFPWYDSMAICLLALYPASRLDWLIMVRLTVATFGFMPGNAGFPAQHVLAMITEGVLYYVAPAVLLATAVILVWLGMSQRWRMDPPFAPGPARSPLTA